MEESLLNPEPKINSEFYKKLQQQIVQKENIIKLLQLKVKNLEDDRGDTPGDGAPPSVLRSEAVERRIKQLEKAERTLQEENDTLARRAARDEEALQDLETRFAATADELARKEQELARAKLHPAGGEDKKFEKLWAEIAALEKKIARKDEENARLRTELSIAAPGGDGARELAELKREVTRLASEKEHVEAMLAQLKDKAPRDGLLDEIVGRKDEEIRTSELERQRLGEEVARLKTRLEEARAHAENSSPAGSFQLVSALITLFQRLADLREQVGARREFDTIEGSLNEVSGLIGLERIRSLGRPVDPELHQIAEVVYSTEHPHDTVIREVAHGYTAHSSVVKLAEVVVSRNPYWCKKCERVAIEGSRYCNICGDKVVGRESPDLKVLDPALTTKSFLDLALAKEQTGDLAAAEKAFLHVLELDSRSLAAAWGAVRVSESQGRYGDAMSGLDRLATLSASADELTRTRQRLRTKREIVERLQGLC